ncbi:hypothetical protein OG369_42625 [Streptomyces sp. NBC_01221]|uniref:hypothetical protein n=1 Tax=Streptomyces sp. NBC_01221 TaxID=2903782 RepID=UPI0022583BD4|nr:hypothetical protein [Streptomyces sp. NBC_01221]MCX4792473.1 hypothetical protein [Streptomyces sp. NBC_01221]
MIRREELCDGRLVKEVDQIDVMSTTHPYHHYVDGSFAWLLDGDEVTPTAAEAFQAAWEAEHSL